MSKQSTESTAAVPAGTTDNVLIALLWLCALGCLAALPERPAEARR